MSSPPTAVSLHSVPEHERTVVPDSSHPLAGFDVLVGSRDALTGCLDRESVARLATRLHGDAAAAVGAVIVEIKGEGAAGNDGSAPPALLRDALRMLTARFLMRHVRGNEPLIRSGDDEFLLVLPGAGPRDTDRVGRRVQLSAFNAAPAALSLGWAARGEGETLGSLVARARATRMAVPQGGRLEERRRHHE